MQTSNENSILFDDIHKWHCTNNATAIAVLHNSYFRSSPTLSTFPSFIPLLFHLSLQVENEEPMQVDDPANDLEESIPESFIVENPVFVSTMYCL